MVRNTNDAAAQYERLTCRSIRFGRMMSSASRKQSHSAAEDAIAALRAPPTPRHELPDVTTIETSGCSPAIWRCQCSSSCSDPSLLLSSWAHICSGRTVWSRMDWMQSLRYGSALRTGMMMLDTGKAGTDEDAWCANMASKTFSRCEAFQVEEEARRVSNTRCYGAGGEEGKGAGGEEEGVADWCYTFTLATTMVQLKTSTCGRAAVRGFSQNKTGYR